MEILIQPVLPAPRLIVFGLSPTARALARLAKAMGYAVHAIDPAADAAAFPGADSVFTSPAALPALKHAAPVFAVVATQGQWDEDAVLAALAHEPDYLGVVASPKRFAEMRDPARHEGAGRRSRANQEPGGPRPGCPAPRGDRPQHPGPDRPGAAGDRRAAFGARGGRPGRGKP